MNHLRDIQETISPRAYHTHTQIRLVIEPLTSGLGLGSARKTRLELGL